MAEFNHEKTAKLIRDKYKDKFKREPSQAVENLISCLDDAFMDEYFDERFSKEKEMVDRMDSVMKAANAEYNCLNSEVNLLESLQEDSGINDPRVSDALKAYRTIVGMSFDTPQQRLQNIQNASYFIWALYAKEGAMSNLPFKQDKVSSVKEENACNPNDPDEASRSNGTDKYGVPWS